MPTIEHTFGAWAKGTSSGITTLTMEILGSRSVRRRLRLPVTGLVAVLPATAQDNVLRVNPASCNVPRLNAYTVKEEVC